MFFCFHSHFISIQKSFGPNTSSKFSTAGSIRIGGSSGTCPIIVHSASFSNNWQPCSLSFGSQNATFTGDSDLLSLDDFSVWRANLAPADTGNSHPITAFKRSEDHAEIREHLPKSWPATAVLTEASLDSKPSYRILLNGEIVRVQRVQFCKVNDQRCC